MANTISASESDRLPWLTDEPKARKGGGRWLLAILAVVAILAVAAGSFWLGMNRTGQAAEQGSAAEPSAVLPIAQPPAAEPQARQAEPAPMTDVEPAPTPPPIAMPRLEEVRPSAEMAPPIARLVRRVAPARAPAPRPRPAPAPRVTAKAAPAKAQPAPVSRVLEFANPWNSEGVSGRMVRIGTYSTLPQGKRAWSRLAKVFPGLKKLPAVVTDIPSLRNGRTYFRLQIGTTSQAHSEVLCQRMRAIAQSCVVVDLAGARKGNWDDGQPAGL
jgi:hypothetical protein